MSARPPIIVILGHVDHGKTTLLDYLRHTIIAAREAGGITQHIRSFQYTAPGGELLTFIDTPGHAAFSQIRTRGSRLADLALLVIAADDGVMPQTRESITLIQQAGIPYIVVITKADLPAADPDRLKTQLTEMGVVVEDYGGPVPSVLVSSKTGHGISELIDLIILSTGLNPPQAEPNGTLMAVVLEAQLDSKKGPLATVIAQQGTLQIGQSLFTDVSVGKIRNLFDSTGASLTQAPPSLPVQILGLSQVPPVGAVLSTVPQPADASLSTPFISPKPATPNPTFSIILRADVIGSLEAILAALDPQIEVLAWGTGAVTENDILQAAAAPAHLVAFNTHLPGSVAKLAETEHVPVHEYQIIYELLDELSRLVHPAAREQIIARGEILAEFKINSDRIAGCRCIEGIFEKGQNLRLERDNQVIAQLRFKNLQLGKTPADRVKSGQEFGCVLTPPVDFKVGDHIIAYTTL